MAVIATGGGQASIARRPAAGEGVHRTPVWLLVAVVLWGSGRSLGAHEFGALHIELGAPQAATARVVVTVDPAHLPAGILPAGTTPEALGETALSLLVDGLAFDSGGVACTLRLVQDGTPTTAFAPSGGPLFRRSFALDLPEGATSVRVSQRLAIGAFVVWAPQIEGPYAPLRWAESGGAGLEVALGATGVSVLPASHASVALDYLRLGFAHIVPKGLDHVCFVLGLFLLSASWRPLLLQVSAFTAAHTVSLALSIYGVVRLPASFVEPAIALSIAYVAIENLATTELGRRRTALVFGFGLVHGLGFAGVLSDLGLPRSRSVTALLAFNLGVELGQLAVLVGAYLLVGWWCAHRSWYRRRVVAPASLAIAGVGLWWFFERLVASG